MKTARSRLQTSGFGLQEFNNEAGTDRAPEPEARGLRSEALTTPNLRILSEVYQLPVLSLNPIDLTYGFSGFPLGAGVTILIASSC